MLHLFVPVSSLKEILDRDLLSTFSEAVDVPAGDEEALLAALLLVHFLHQFIVGTLEVWLVFRVVVVIDSF